MFIKREVKSQHIHPHQALEVEEEAEEGGEEAEEASGEGEEEEGEEGAEAAIEEDLMGRGNARQRIPSIHFVQPSDPINQMMIANSESCFFKSLCLCLSLSLFLFLFVFLSGLMICDDVAAHLF
jgi:hypothetical protein